MSEEYTFEGHIIRLNSSCGVKDSKIVKLEEENAKLREVVKQLVEKEGSTTLKSDVWIRAKEVLKELE